MQDAPGPRSSGVGWILAVIPLFLLGGVAFYYMNKSVPPPEPPKQEAYSEFNLPTAPPPADPFAGAKLPPPGARHAPQTKESLGLSGFSPEGDGIFKRTPGQKRSAQNAREKAFIKKYDHIIRKEQERVDAIAVKWWKKSKMIREMDAAFGGLPRLMKLKQKYEKDRDPYSFARDAVSLPEVRKMIRKYSTKPEVWGIAVDMALEALQKKPPKPVYDEMARFLSSDKKVGGFIGKYTEWIAPKVPQIVTQGLPPGKDLGPIQSVLADVVPGAGGGTTSKRTRKKRR